MFRSKIFEVAFTTGSRGWSSRCIVVTSFSDTSRLIELINQAQITRFLPKPVSKGILARNLESMLERFHAI